MLLTLKKNKQLGTHMTYNNRRITVFWELLDERISNDS